MEFTVRNESNPLATITMESGDIIVIELFPDIAPNTVNNFISLANSGFYDGVIFHRVIPNFMIQGGCPDGTGMGGPGYSIFGEFGANGFENNLSHTRGVVSMARTPAPNSGGSQFFICVGDPTFLDNDYAGFGMVVHGMEVADAIVAQPRDRNDRPNEPQRIATIAIDTRGVTFPAPERM
ncbi:MAG: peptidylprolyl isomerase [Defluviitaleaceae bacterium]|nr:peptidylprolyl isomerase [Defluviitaleaceae bacterium]